MIGLHADGGLAEFLTVPGAMCVPVPAHVPDLAAVLTEPLAVAVRATRRAEPANHERVLVLGAGTIGQCVGQLLLTATAQVSLLDTDARRIAATPGLDATTTAAPDHPWSGAADCVIDCAGTETSFDAALNLVRPGGRVVLVGAAPRASGFSPHDLLVREVTLRTTFSHDRDEDTRAAVALLAYGALHLDHVVTDVVPLSDAVERVFHEPATGFKTVVAPQKAP
jgi:threonine dehydrogenase-like Zn-dependent dehydrogenase